MAMETVNWNEFYNRFVWRQGEHVAIIGATGSGKTYLSFRLCQKRSYVVYLATKGQDEGLQRDFKKYGYEIIRKWPASDNVNKIAVWPKFRQTTDIVNQRVVFRNATREIFASGGWTCVIDELYYTTNILYLRPEVTILWTQGRSHHISVVSCVQRPKDVPTMLYDQSKHLFFFRYRDLNDLKRIGDIGWLDGRIIRETVSKLNEHEFLYINSETGVMMISKANGV